MNMFARFDENPAMTLRVIKETKRYGRTDGRTDTRTDARTDARTDNMKTVYPLQTKFAGGYKNINRGSYRNAYVLLNSWKLYSRTPDRDFCCFYSCEIFLSHTPVPAIRKDKKLNSRTLVARRSVTSVMLK